MMNFMMFAMLVLQLQELDIDNLFTLSNFNQLQLDPGLSACKSTMSGDACLKIVALNTLRKDPSVTFATIQVKPGNNYSYLMVTETHAQNKGAHQVMYSGKNLVWPGAIINNGISVTQFQVPDTVNEITIGFAFFDVTNNESMLIRDIALYEGEISPSHWKSNQNAGLMPAFKIEEFEIENIWFRIFLFILTGIALLTVGYFVLDYHRIGN